MNFYEKQKLLKSTLQVASKNDLKSNFKSFEDVYKTSYSHGLEEIYSLENVDLKTVRPITTLATFQPQQEILVSPVKQDPQLHFDFGETFSETLDSFLLKEPIEVLGLARHVEKCLAEKQIYTLKNLLNEDLQKLIFVKGIGQGHVEEINQKLKNYLEGQHLYQCSTIDFSAWMRSLFAKLNRKKIYVTMESYQLADLFSLSPIESVEVRRLTLEKRSELKEEIADELLLLKKEISLDIQKITQTFVLPWIKRRFGFATKQEVIERLERVSKRSAITSLVLDFLSDFYYQGEFAISQFIYKDLLFADKETYYSYINVIDQAKSYFYNPSITYPFSHLVMLISREFAKNWQGFNPGFIEKILRSSDLFCSRKDSSGELVIRLT